jgi:hypothetical protein
MSLFRRSAHAAPPCTPCPSPSAPRANVCEPLPAVPVHLQQCGPLPPVPNESGRQHFGFVWDYTDTVLSSRSALASRANAAMSTWFGSEPPTFIMAYLKQQLEITNTFRARLNQWFQQNQKPVLSEQRASEILQTNLSELSRLSTGPVGVLCAQLLRTMSHDSQPPEHLAKAFEDLRQDEQARQQLPLPTDAHRNLREEIRRVAFAEPQNLDHLREFDMVV